LSRILSLRVHLDASTSDNGPLKIVPESHWMGVMSAEEVLTFAAKRHHVECLVGQGGGFSDATIVDTLLVQRAE